MTSANSLCVFLQSSCEFDVFEICEKIRDILMTNNSLKHK